MPGSKRRGLLGGKVESIVINVYSVTDLWREATHPGRVDVVSKVFVVNGFAGAADTTI